MKETEKETLPLYEDSSRRDRKQWFLLLMLLIMTLCTSSLAGYILGKKADAPFGGQLIDTILLTPQAQNEKSTVLHLTGRVLYTDGTPAAGRRLELHSEPVRTVTDSAGAFLFDHVPLGEHSLCVINEDGTTAAERNVVLDRKQELNGISIDMNDDGIYVVELAMDVRMLEISIELDSANYFINTENFTYSTTDGVVVMPAGSASIQDGPVVTPAGNVCLPDGTIVMSGKQAEDPTAVILPDDTVIHPKEKLSAGAAEVLPDGTVNLPDGTIIGPDGEIHTPNGEIQAPGGQETGDSKKEESGGGADIGPDHSRPDSGENGSTAESGGSGTSSGGSGGGGNGSGSGGSGSSSGGSGSSETTSPEPTVPKPTEDPDKGFLDVLEQQRDTSEYQSWTQLTTIDLFYNRSGGSSNPMIPGSKGYYQFRLKNTRSEGLSINLTMTEGDIHLPLSFSLTPQSSSKSRQKAQSVIGSLSGDKSRLVLKTEIEANEEKDFRLDWEWPSQGNDREDTKAGSADNAYTLTLTVNAEGMGK